MSNENQKYNLILRTNSFGKNVLKFAKTIPRSIISMPVITQFVRAGTSVGANYCEADNAESKNDFKHKLSISKKEAKETIYWVDMINTIYPNLEKDANIIKQEATELNLIFNAIIKKCDSSLIWH